MPGTTSDLCCMQNRGHRGVHRRRWEPAVNRDEEGSPGNPCCESNVICSETSEIDSVGR